VSKGSFPDTLVVEMNKSELFVGNFSQKSLKAGTVYKRIIPSQKQQTSATKLLSKVADLVRQVLEFLTSMGGVSSFFFGFALSNVWSMINGLQIIVFYPLFQVDAPYNLGILQAALRKIATFELIDGDIVKGWWAYEKDEEVDFYVQEAGYDSYVFMFTMGLPLYIFTINVILLALLPALICLTKKCSICRTPNQKFTGMLEALKWNFFVMFFLEAALEICVSVTFGCIIFFKKAEDYIQVSHNILAILFSVLYGLCITWIFKFLYSF